LFLMTAHDWLGLASASEVRAGAFDFTLLGWLRWGGQAKNPSD
jgi:hypothetical protein